MSRKLQRKSEEVPILAFSGRSSRTEANVPEARFWIVAVLTSDLPGTISVQFVPAVGV